MSLSLGKIFRFLTSLDVGYLSSSIEPTHGKGTSGNRSQAGKYGYHSKASKHSNHSHSGHTKNKESLDDLETSSSKGLVPGGYGRATTEVEGVIPMHDWKDSQVRQQEITHGGRRSSEAVSDIHPMGNEIRVTTRFEVRPE